MAKGKHLFRSQSSRVSLTRTASAQDTRLIGTVGNQPDVFMTAHTTNADVAIQPAK